MPGLGHQQDGRYARLGQVSQCRLPKLVQGGSVAGLGEDLGGSAVRQPRLSSPGVKIAAGHSPAGSRWPSGQEERSSCSPAMTLGRSRAVPLAKCRTSVSPPLLMITARRAVRSMSSTLRLRLSTSVGGPGGGFVEQAPKAAVPDADVAAGEQPVQRFPVEGLAVILSGPAAFQRPHEVHLVVDPAVPLREGDERLQGGNVPVPRVRAGALRRSPRLVSSTGEALANHDHLLLD